MSKNKRILISVFLILAVFLACVWGFLRRQYVVPILMYHSVAAKAEPAKRLVVSVATFDRQMRFLKENRYNVISLEELTDLIREKKKIPAHTIAITFDDGYEDNYTNAFPVLEKYGFPATMFIIVNEVGRPQADRLSWDEIKKMRASGLIAFGSHCLGPEPLVNISSAAQRKREIEESKRILETKLGSKIDLFSYPEGLFDSQIRALVISAGYRGAVATSPGRDHPKDDVYALKRIRISESAANMFVFRVESSGYYTFMKEWKKEHKKKKNGGR